jgi:hypothetical protein
MDHAIGWFGRLCTSLGLAALCLSPLFAPAQQAWAGGISQPLCNNNCVPITQLPPCAVTCNGSCDPVQKGVGCVSCPGTSVNVGGFVVCTCLCGTI